MEYRNPKDLMPHPVSLKLYGGNTIADLLESIKEYGIRVPLTITDKNVVISGHRRWHCACELELESVPVEVEHFEDELAEKKAILDFNKQREKTFSQKGNEADLWEEIIAEEAKIRQKNTQFGNHGATTNSATDTKGETADIVGRITGIGGGDTYRKSKKIRQAAKQGNKQAKKLIEDIDTGDKTIGRAFKELQSNEKRIAFIENKQEIPKGIYDVFYVDPPWQYDFGEVSREVENQYPTMTLQQIKDLSIQLEEHIADTSVLFLWATAPKLLEAIDVMKAWGFSYRTNAVWDKEKIGMGYWFRGQHELLLVGVKGNYPPPTTDARFSSVIREPRTNHSEKPECVYAMIEAICPNSKYIELFARNKRDGWQIWGNQTV